MKTILLCACLLCTTISNGQPLYWVGTASTDWDNGANWSATSGGAGGAGAPGTSNQVFIDAVTANTPVLNTTASVQQFTISNNSLSFGASGVLNVSSNFVLQGGTISLNTSGVINANGTFTFTAGTFNAGSGTIRIPNNTLSISGGVLNAQDGNFFIGSNVTVTTSLVIIGGTSTVTFNGGGQQNVLATNAGVPGNIAFYNLVIDKPNNSVIQFTTSSSSDTFEVRNLLTLKAGKFEGSGFIKIEKDLLTNNTFGGSGIPIACTGPNSGTVTLGSPLAVTGVSNFVGIFKSDPSATVSVFRGPDAPDDTIRIGNSNARFIVREGIIDFPNNPPIKSTFGWVEIESGGTFKSTSDHLSNAGTHLNSGGNFLHNNGTYIFKKTFNSPTTQFASHKENFNNLVIDIEDGFFNPSANDTLIVNGLFNFKSGIWAGSTNGAINAKGDVLFESTAQPIYVTSTLLISGTGNQNIQFGAGNEGAWDGSVLLNKPSGDLILNSPWTMDASGKTFTFARGILRILDTANNYLYFTNGHSPVGASNISYVDGPVRVKRWANDPFEFPIGNGGFYGPIRLANFWQGDDATFSAQYFYKASAQAGGPKDATLQNIGRAEYWEIRKVAGTSAETPFVWLSFDNIRSGGVTDPSKLRVSKWDGTKWVDRGGTPSGNFIQTTQPILDFSPFTLASTDAVANPLVGVTLPVHLASFIAEAKGGYNFVEWKADNEVNFDSYQIESGTNGSSFTALGSVKAIGDGAAHTYSFTDATPGSKTFYRLKLVEKDGDFDYSKVVAVNRSVRGLTMMISPNPGKDRFTVVISSESASAATIQVSDAQGKLLRKEQIQIKNGVNSFDMEAGELPRGIYFIEIKTNRGERQVQRYSVMK